MSLTPPLPRDPRVRAHDAYSLKLNSLARFAIMELSRGSVLSLPGFTHEKLGEEPRSTLTVLFEHLRKHLPNELPKEPGQEREHRVGLVDMDEMDFHDWQTIATRNGFKDRYPDGKVKSVYEFYTHLDLSLHALEMVGMCMDFDAEPHEKGRKAAEHLCLAICGGTNAFDI